VTNLLPLHKNATERLLSEQTVEGSWIDGKSSSTITIPPGEDRTHAIDLDVPSGAARADYPAVIAFAGASLRREVRVTPPVSAVVTLPHGAGMRLRVQVVNNVARTLEAAVDITLPPGMKARGKLQRSVRVGGRGTTTLEIPYALEGASPKNQHYPVKIRLTADAFAQETERDFYIGRASYARATPSLDGSWRGWNLDRPVTIDSIAQASKLLLGNQPWRGARDLSAALHVMFDDRYLYVGAKVRDDSVVTTWDFPAMSYPWDTDCLEVVLDTRTGANQASDPPTPGLRRHLSLAEYRTTLFPPEKWQGAGAGGPLLPRPLLVPGAETYWAKTTDGYSIICRYPLAALELKPGSGVTTLGFDAAINDNDGTTYRKNTHIWAGYTRNQTWWDMGTIGVLLLQR
jgi:hypothetical protein